MSNKIPQVKIVDLETGEEIIRDASPEELKRLKLDIEEGQAKQVALEERQAARQAILDRLGLTADEAKLILG